MSDRNWQADLRSYENFLKNIDVQKYSHLRAIKTVEQDLPDELLPLEIYYNPNPAIIWQNQVNSSFPDLIGESIHLDSRLQTAGMTTLIAGFGYKYYWETTDFKSYDEVFPAYWSEKLNPYIYEFIRKYFYGCSLQFVEEGFKARLYRIWMSILTQFHFQYLWNALFKEKLESDAMLDSMGLDAVLNLKEKRIGIQIKKVSYRREVSDRRFTKKQQKHVDIVVEIPYVVEDTTELKAKILNPRTKAATKEKCRRRLPLFNKNFHKYNNGFVVFKKEYLKHIHRTIEQKTFKPVKGKIPYNEILIW
jgi:hypothetical protein